MQNSGSKLISRGSCLRRGAAGALAALVCCCLWGCSSSEPGFQFDRLDVSPNRESLIEFSLGEYEIPIPVADERQHDPAKRRNRLKFNFELHALVAPDEASHVADSWERHEGTIRDRVIQVCRTASLAELQELEYATLKARLMDAVQAQLGEREVRRLLMTEVDSQEL